MVATGEPAADSLRNCFLVEVDMAKRCRIVLAAVVKIDPPPFLQSRAEIRHRQNIFARPAALTHKRSGDEKDAARHRVRGLFGESIDENGCADRMGHQNGAVIELRELFLKSRLPERVLRIAFIGHVRIADFIIRTEFSLKTPDEFAVPFVMRTLAATLNE